VAAVDALNDVKVLAVIAKTTVRDLVASRALSRISDAHARGSIARHAATESARREAFDALARCAEHAEIVAVAMNSEYKDTALSALDLVTDRHELEQIGERGKNKSAAKRARAIVREEDERVAREAEHARDLAREAAQATAERLTPPLPSIEPSTNQW